MARGPVHRRQGASNDPSSSGRAVSHSGSDAESSPHTGRWCLVPLAFILVAFIFVFGLTKHQQSSAARAAASVLGGWRMGGGGQEAQARALRSGRVAQAEVTALRENLVAGAAGLVADSTDDALRTRISRTRARNERLRVAVQQAEVLAVLARPTPQEAAVLAAVRRRSGRKELDGNADGADMGVVLPPSLEAHTVAVVASPASLLVPAALAAPAIIAAPAAPLLAPAALAAPAIPAAPAAPAAPASAAIPRYGLEECLSLGKNAESDVRGNLGPATVVTDPKVGDWLKDRWQAASDMSGRPIPGNHWLTVDLGPECDDDDPTSATTSGALAGGALPPRPASCLLSGAVIDFETAFADKYFFSVRTTRRTAGVVDGTGAGGDAGGWSTPVAMEGDTPRQETSEKHIVHNLRFPGEGVSGRYVKLSFTGLGSRYGVSVWRLDIKGRRRLREE